MASNVHWKARLLFIALLLIGGAGALVWNFWSSSRYRTYWIETHEPPSGLVAGAPVEFHGVNVGQVTDVALRDADTVRITLEVAKTAPVSKATVATITARGLTAWGFSGYVYIALENTAPASGPLPIAPGEPYPRIAAAPARIVTMDTMVAQSVDKLQTLMQLLEPLANEQTVASVKASLESLQMLSHSLDGLQQSADALAAALDKKTVASLKRSLEGLQQVAAILAVNGKRLDSLIINAERDSRDIRALVETSNSTLRTLNAQVLPQFSRAIVDLETLSRTMNGLATRLSRNPSALVSGTTLPPGPGER